MAKGDDGLGGTPVEDLPAEETTQPAGEGVFLPTPNEEEETEGGTLAWLEGADEDTIKYATGKKWDSPVEAAKSAREAESRMRKLESEKAEALRRADEVEQYAVRAGQGDERFAGQPPSEDLDGALAQAMTQIGKMYDDGQIDGAKAEELRAQVVAGYSTKREEQMLARVSEMINGQVGPIQHERTQQRIEQAIDGVDSIDRALLVDAVEILQELPKAGLPEELVSYLQNTDFGVQWASGQAALRRMDADAQERRRAPETINSGSRGRQGVDVAQEILKHIEGATSRRDDGL